MKLRLPEETAWPRLRARRLLGATALALGLALGLTGCGPGTGGTGTGYPASSALAGNAAWAKGSWSSVASSADSAHATPPDCASTAPAPCASTAVLLDLTASGIRVDAGCWAFAYDGPWGDPASSNWRVTGLYTAPGATGGVATQPADLRIETRDPDVVLTVLDARGRVLQGPVTLMRSPDGARSWSSPTGCAGPEIAPGTS